MTEWLPRSVARRAGRRPAAAGRCLLGLELVVEVLEDRRGQVILLAVEDHLAAEAVEDLLRIVRLGDFPGG